MTSSAERVAPGASNPPPAIWPATALTPSAEIDAAAIAAHLVSSLNAALAKGDVAAVADLFIPDPGNAEGEGGATPYWRDHLVLSWKLRTVKGRGGIRGFLEGAEGAEGGGPGGVKMEVDGSNALRTPQVMGFRPTGGAEGVGFFVRVENGEKVGRGVVRAVEVERGVWKVWTLFTKLEGIKGAEESTGARRGWGVEHGGVAGRKNWAERRREEGEFREKGPEVLVIGEFLVFVSLALEYSLTVERGQALARAA
jgi:hypothetical protein